MSAQHTPHLVMNADADLDGHPVLLVKQDLLGDGTDQTHYQAHHHLKMLSASACALVDIEFSYHCVLGRPPAILGHLEPPNIFALMRRE